VTKIEELKAQSDIAALAIAEQRYRALVRATSSLVWVTAADGQIEDMPEWRAYTGESVEQIKGWGWLNSLHPGDRERTAIVWQRAVDTRTFYETDYRIRRSDGVYVWHRARGVPVLQADGSIREWVGICLDITHRKHAEEKRIEAETALRRLNQVLEQRVESEARERARIWNVSQDMLAVSDLEGKLLSLNPAWTTSLGWSDADLIGNTYEWLLHPDDLSKSRAELARLAKGGKTQQFENRLRHKDGSFRWLSWTAVSDSGRIYAVARDMTAIKASEEELRSSRRELRRVGQQLTMAAITASMAHEINQPLSAIAANAGAGLRWLSGKPPNIDKAAAALDRIVKDGHRVNHVIETVRAMFTSDSQEKTLFDINDLILEVFDLLHTELQRNDVLVKHALAEGLPRILVDRVQLQQVVMNLVMNAVEAMKQVIDRPRTLQISSGRHDPTGLIITLEDSGTGIDPENLKRVFEPFFTTKPHGTGMGLSICRSIIEAHRGRLVASPARPHGTTFYVILPVDE
jgi:PAS domain S-box-containing protein